LIPLRMRQFLPNSDLDRFRDGLSLFGGLLEISDEIGSLVLLLEACENHLSARDVFLGILQVLPQRIFAPSDTLGLVSVGIFVAGSLASLATKKTMKIRADFVWASFFNSMALSAPLNEKLLALVCVSSRNVRHPYLDLDKDSSNLLLGDWFDLI